MRRRNPNDVDPKSPSFLARVTYWLTHWGRFPSGVVEGEACDVCDADLVSLGYLTEIVYATRKGEDQDFVEYDHHFGPENLPLLAFDRKTRRLVIVGGGYTVTARGIER